MPGGWLAPSGNAQSLKVVNEEPSESADGIGISEDRTVGNLGARLELPQPPHERAQQLEPARPGARIGAAVAVTPCPLRHDLHAKVSALPDPRETLS